jgi:pyruvate/2-oxoglutarate dehydrogenase complex dihydrolipoamide dehydrogenase (E3) component
MAKKYEFDYDLIVIGSGAGGSAAATIAARDGKRVAIIESDIFGGESPNWSDVPTKALLHAATLYDEARHGAKFGLRSSTLGYNYPSIRAWKDLAVKRTGAAGNRKYYDSQGIDTFAGLARFISPNEISINRRHLSADNFLIATGSQWTIPQIPGLDTINYLTPKTILETIRPPKNLLIIGGNDIAVEIAQLMAIFGTKVYIVEKSSRLLPNFDRGVGELLEKTLANQKGITTLSHSNVVSITKEGLSKKVIVSRAGTEKSIRVDEILIADDKSPNVDLGLENAGVKFTTRGIKVNDFLQTNVRHIFAAGEVLGRDSATHAALLESQVAVNNIFKHNKIPIDYTANPRVIFTHPAIATVGLSEDDCSRKKRAINTALVPLNVVARSNTADFRDGFVKIITDKRGVILGATIFAPSAGELIHELALAVRCSLTANDIAQTQHAFLSWSEAIRAAAGKLA